MGGLARVDPRVWLVLGALFVAALAVRRSRLRRRQPVAFRLGRAVARQRRRGRSVGHRRPGRPGRR